MKPEVLQLRNLAVQIGEGKNSFEPVKEVNLTIRQGEILSLVGESACGKSMTAMAVMGLLPPQGKIKRGTVLLQGRDITHLANKRKLRGKEMGMIFQEPMTSLNPVYRIGDQVRESLLVHNQMTAKQAKETIIEMLRDVGIASDFYHAYPHQLSGGMRQRVMIAMALICRPALLIADEPTTALDVTIQSQILHLLQQLCSRLNTAVLLITHDLGIAAQVADKVAVMYAGWTVESTSTTEFFRQPRHPYTIGLLNSLPDRQEQGKLTTIPGSVPDGRRKMSGCVFANRCAYRQEKCGQSMPPIEEPRAAHLVRCFYHNKLG